MQESILSKSDLTPVSYTHLDVYKRQAQQVALHKNTYQNCDSPHDGDG